MVYVASRRCKYLNKFYYFLNLKFYFLFCIMYSLSIKVSLAGPFTAIRILNRATLSLILHFFKIFFLYKSEFPRKINHNVLSFYYNV